MFYNLYCKWYRNIVFLQRTGKIDSFRFFSVDIMYVIVFSICTALIKNLSRLLLVLCFTVIYILYSLHVLKSDNLFLSVTVIMFIVYVILYLFHIILNIFSLFCY